MDGISEAGGRVLNIIMRCKSAIKNAFIKKNNTIVSDNGYVSCINENLLPSVELSEDVICELNDGSGNELKKKFKALHSSAALAVNTFAKWKENTENLFICGNNGFKTLIFEKKCPTGLKGSPPNLDVFLDNDKFSIAIESKFLEYLSPKKGYFSVSYKNDTLPQSEKDCWYIVDWIKNEPKQHLDTAQLIKHYLGLRNLPQNGDKEIILEYIFWEPENWRDFEVFHKHRSEILKFASYFEKLSVKFKYQSYPELWDEWDQYYGESTHVRELRERYFLKI